MSSPAGVQAIAVMLQKADLNITYDRDTHQPTKSTAFHDLVSYFPEDTTLIDLFLKHGGDPNLIYKKKTVLQTLLYAQKSLVKHRNKVTRPNHRRPTIIKIGKFRIRTGSNPFPLSATNPITKDSASPVSIDPIDLDQFVKDQQCCKGTTKAEKSLNQTS
jgi:hypothetical protein